MADLCNKYIIIDLIEKIMNTVFKLNGMRINILKKLQSCTEKTHEGWVGGAGQAMVDGKKQTKPPTSHAT